jgi:hypothetical protein
VDAFAVKLDQQDQWVEGFYWVQGGAIGELTVREPASATAAIVGTVRPASAVVAVKVSGVVRADSFNVGQGRLVRAVTSASQPAMT